MAVLMTQTMPEGVTVQMLDAVSEAMGVTDDPPAGMVVHVHYEQDGRTQVVDVWESRQAYETFEAERLMPAMQRVASEHGMSAPSPEEVGAPSITSTPSSGGVESELGLAPILGLTASALLAILGLRLILSWWDDRAPQVCASARRRRLHRSGAAGTLSSDDRDHIRV